MFGQFDIALVRGLVHRVDQQLGMNRYGNAARRPLPSDFVDRPPRQDEGRARACSELERLAACQHLALGRSAQHYVEEVLDVLVARYDARRDGVVLDSEACPAHGSTRQRWMGMQEWLDAPFTPHLDRGKDEGSTR